MDIRLTAASDRSRLDPAQRARQRPDLIISDYHLPKGKTGIEAIERIGAAFTHRFRHFISGDTAPERLRDAKDKGYILLPQACRPDAATRCHASALPGS